SESRVLRAPRDARIRRGCAALVDFNAPATDEAAPPLYQRATPHPRLIGDLPDGRNASLVNDNVPGGIDAVCPIARQDVGAPDHDALALPAPATTRLLHTPPQPVAPQVCPHRACDAPHRHLGCRTPGCRRQAFTRSSPMHL